MPCYVLCAVLVSPCCAQVYICVSELIPMALKYDPNNAVASKAIMAGMFVMALSLVLFDL